MKIRIDKVTVEEAFEVYDLMQLVLQRETKLSRDIEHFWVLALNKANKILNLELVAFGANNRLQSRAADILAIPLQKQAQKVILVHNQPSGIIKPSEEDKDFTNKIIKACQLVDMELSDHIIMTHHSYFSFKDTDLLERLERSSKYLLSYELERKLQEELQEAIQEIEQESKVKIKESLKKGEEKGLKKREMEIAKQMLEDGEPMNKIQRWTGLSEAKINALK